jgi:hypothetical protein
VGDELAASGKHNHNAIQEATAFLEDKWEDLQHRASKAGKRMKKALDQAWHRLTQ